jgi:hypothetical protein
MPNLKEMVENFSFPSASIGRNNPPSTDEGARLMGVSANARAAEMGLLALKALERNGEKVSESETRLLKVTLAMNYEDGGIAPGEFGAQKLVDDFLKKADAALDTVYGKSPKIG